MWCDGRGWDQLLQWFHYDAQRGEAVSLIVFILAMWKIHRRVRDSRGVRLVQWWVKGLVHTVLVSKGETQWVTRVRGSVTLPISELGRWSRCLNRWHFQHNHNKWWQIFAISLSHSRSCEQTLRKKACRCVISSDSNHRTMGLFYCDTMSNCTISFDGRGDKYEGKILNQDVNHTLLLVCTKERMDVKCTRCKFL